ncbi:MAG: HEAT repeat domain-containing protein [Planctomycetes bacterium]|nr:HEAT repeat domain-containing protein [Planctomycetota bacterium]
MARWTAGVEYLARTGGAAQPVDWDGDVAFLFVTAPTPRGVPLAAFRMALAMWERAGFELGLRARLGVHVSEMSWRGARERLAHPEVRWCGRLAEATAPGTVAVSEDVVLALPPAEQARLFPLGALDGAGVPAFGFPACAAANGVPATFALEPDHHLWAAFRAYALGPEIRCLRYVGFRLARKEPPNLDVRAVFVPLEAAPRGRRRLVSMPPAPGASAATSLAAHAPEGDAPGWLAPGCIEELAGTSLPIVRALAEHRRLVVLGDPGSGKSTLVRWLAVVAAEGRFLLGQETGVGERLLPLPVSVGRLADVRASYGRPCSVEEVLARYFHERNVGPAEQVLPFLRKRLASGEGMLLLDGCDEVREGERTAMRQWLESFLVQSGKNRLVATSRTVGYLPLAIPEAEEVILQGLSEVQVERYVVAFDRAYFQWETGAPQPMTAGKKARELLASIKASQRLGSLARNPFVLSALSLIHRAEGTLPRHRVQAYEVFARSLCEAWASARRLVHGEVVRDIPYEEDALPILGHLALEMHHHYPAGVAPEAFVLRKLAESLSGRSEVSPDEAERAARKFLERAGQEVQILLERGAGAWGFLHLTFQEFFAAAGLHAQERFEEVAWARLFDPRWLEVIRLGIGYQALIQKRPEAVRRFIQRIRERPECPQHPWIVEVLRKHIPIATLLAAEAGDALPKGMQTAIAGDFLEWSETKPFDWFRGNLLREIAGSNLATLLGDTYLSRLDGPWQGLAFVIGALGKVRDERAVPSLSAILRDLKNPAGVRCMAALSLGQINDPSALGALMQVASDPSDTLVQHFALHAIREMRATEAVPLLVRTCGSSDRGTADLGKQAVRRFGQLEIIVHALAAIGAEEAETRAGGALALGEVKFPGDFRKLVPCLRDPEKRVRIAAATALGTLARPESVEELLLALSDGNPHVRKSTVVGLARVGGRFASSVLASAIRPEKQEETQSLAQMISESRASKLGERFAKDSVDAFTRALLELDPQVRSRRLEEAFTKASSEAAALVRKDSLWEPVLVRAADFGLLADSAPEASIPALIERLQNPEESHRALAAQALGELKAREAVQPLLAALNDTDSGVRSSAISALSMLGPDVPVEPLVDMARSPKPGSREHLDAVCALWRISEELSCGGKALGQDASGEE